MKQGVLFVIFLITLTAICDTISQLFLKSTINSINLQVNNIGKIIKLIIRIMGIPRVWIGFFFSTLSLLIWLFALTKSELSFAFSIDSMHYIFIAFGSLLVLKEKIGSLRWVGIISIVVGIALVSVS